MTNDALFCTLDSQAIAEKIHSAVSAVCYAGPGIQPVVAQAMVMVGGRLGLEMLTVCLDFDERVMRMGYGDIGAVRLLRDSGINVRSAQGLRTGLLIVDDVGFVFTPTPLYLEAEPAESGAPNAVRMSSDQMAEALARLSPAAKAIALAQAKTPAEKVRIEAFGLDVKSDQVNDIQFLDVEEGLEKAPPVRFDLARQVRVFEPYLQYVELSLTGAAIQRHRLAIPPVIQKLGGSKDLEKRLRTTFELIEKGSKLSSKPLDDALNKIRTNFTKSLGKDQGRVVLKSSKPLLTKQLEDFRKMLEEHQKKVAAGLQVHLEESRKQIVDYYIPRVVENPPVELRAQLLSGKVTENVARYWLDAELNGVFPDAASLIKEMKLEERYKDVTFETLNREDFLSSVKAAYKYVDWDRAYSEFKAAGEIGGKKSAG